MNNFKLDTKTVALSIGSAIFGAALYGLISRKGSKSGKFRKGERERKTVTVCITGAAGNIGYAFIPLVANGSVFGRNTTVNLKLLDIPVAVKKLNGIQLELEDGAYPNLGTVEVGDDPKVLFKDCDVIVFIGGVPRKEGMERKNLLKFNGGIFSEQGKALQEVGKETVRCLVVANPANTNCWILRQSAPKIPAKNFSCLTRLDENRAYTQIAKKCNTTIKEIKDIFIWGNHSKTQYPDITHATVTGKSVDSTVKNREYLQDEFVKTVQNRGGEILKETGLTSIFSAANAIKDHLKNWYLGTDNHHSQGCVSSGEYNVPKDLIFSYPVQYLGNWEYKIVEGLNQSDFCKEKIAETIKELEEEKSDYLSIPEEPAVN